MNTVTISKKDFIEKVTANREQHRAEFEKAVEGFRNRVIAELDRRLEDVKAGRKITLYLDLPEPQDHTDDYDRVLLMAEMSVDENLELSNRDFGAYIMDQWSWKQEFMASNSHYTN